MPTALVTGADRGLGLSLCEALCRRGWLVYAGQFLPDWPELCALAERYPQTLRLLPLDVGSDASVRALGEALRAENARIDLLINNAGVTSRGEPDLFSEEEDFGPTRRAFSVNAVGPLRVVRACLPCMREGMKRLCFISSEAGAITVAHRAEPSGYCMSKAALNMAVRLLYNELRPEGYTFRLFHPGWLRSYMAGRLNESATVEPEDAAEAATLQFLGDRRNEDRLVVLDNAGAAWPF